MLYLSLVVHHHHYHHYHQHHQQQHQQQHLPAPRGPQNKSKNALRRPLMKTDENSAAWEPVLNDSTHAPAVSAPLIRFHGGPFHCMLLHCPDSGNSPGNCFWMGWWGYAKRQEFRA